MCQGQSNTTGVLSSFCCPCVLSMRIHTLHMEWNETFPTVPPAGQTDKWKVLEARVKAENVPKWAQPSQESIWESGWEVRDGAGKRVMECEMCTENDKEGRGWERHWQ
jgi:hypothetical protein